MTQKSSMLCKHCGWLLSPDACVNADCPGPRDAAMTHCTRCGLRFPPNGIACLISACPLKLTAANNLASPVNRRAEPQHPPPPCPIATAVAQEVMARSAAGLKKYGVTLARTDLSRAQWLQHAKEEAIDLACYLQKLIELEKAACTADEALTHLGELAEQDHLQLSVEIERLRGLLLGKEKAP